MHKLLVKQLLENWLKKKDYCVEAFPVDVSDSFVVEETGEEIENAASVPRMYMSAYAASKAAVIIFTKCLGLELAKYQIR